MWVYDVGHTRFSEFRNVSANLFLIFTRLWTKVVVSIKGSPNGKFNGYPSIPCNSPGTWVIDGPAIYSRSWFIYLMISFRNLLWVMWWMKESSILQDSLSPRSLRKQIFEQISIDWASINADCRSIHVIVHPTSVLPQILVSTVYNISY